MLWLILSVVGAFFDATYYAAVKRFLSKTSEYVLGAGVFLAASAIMLAVSAVHGFPKILPGFAFNVAATAAINVAASILFYKSLKSTDISLSVPMISFTPAFLILTSFLMLGELPTLVGGAGIFFIVIGSYVLNISAKGKGFFSPFKSMVRNKGTLYVLIVAFLYSISSNFDKKVILASDAFFGVTLIYAIMGISFLAISLFRKDTSRRAYVQKLPSFLLVAAILSAIAITINIAMTLQIVPYIIAVKRVGILFSVLYGGMLFKEGSMRQRVLGAGVMLVGLVLIVAF